MILNGWSESLASGARRRSGCSWQSGGGYDRNITDGATLLKMIDYIHLNPVRKGLVERASDWTWSSAGWYETGQVGKLIIDQIPADWLGEVG